MGIIFFGLMFLTLEMDMYLTSGTVIGLLPDAVGFILLLLGLNKLKTNSPYFRRALSLCIGMVPPSAILFGMGVIGLLNGFSLAGLLLGLLCMVGRLVVGFVVIRGFRDMELQDDVDMHAVTLRNIWLCFTLVSAAAYLISGISMLGMMAVFAVNIVGLCFMVFFYRTKNKFEEIYVFE